MITNPDTPTPTPPGSTLTGYATAITLSVTFWVLLVVAIWWLA